MVAMAATVDEFPMAESGPFTVHDLEGMPDDGRRYELIDGEIFVSPVPGTRHQTVAYRLFAVLDAVCPADLMVLGAPYAIQPHERTELQPDLLVGRRRDFTEKLLPVAPVLAVEVLSPSTGFIDRKTKKDAYRKLGTHSYWVIDPKRPSMTVFELDEAGRYEQIAKVVGGKPHFADRPFPVRIVLTELLDEFGYGWKAQ